MKTLVYSHGFGVTASSRGLFTEITNNLTNIKSIMFDYNEVHPNGDVTVNSIYEQSRILQDIINKQNGEIILLGHSQGSLIIGLVDLSKISKVILLAPPLEMNMQHVIDKMSKRTGSNINIDGLSKLMRSDGTATYISKDYMHSLDDIRPIEIYQKIANTKPTLIIRATNDNVLGLTNVDEIKNAKHVDIYADHDFSGVARTELINQLKLFL